ncbi:alpha/beta hydrolase [Candidatus Nitrospira neomarina]|uniref:Alpha/beta hydrolase n=1 Tax=Candidatus Nitrospira neomarina TaxID=3020899 RepID=A0AA96GT70_9BACT|nr:alpha/beta hydrolase [Candidatus Nitrospira neomarina]WNM63146.1 alpha/beta hydrolase [Candidatus Nitrospira neomarina]
MPSSDLGLVLELLALQREQEMSSIEERRLIYDSAESAFSDESPQLVEDVVANGVSTEWIPGPIDSSNNHVVLYAHGGGYNLGSPRSHRHLAAAIGREALASVIVPDYRLAPEHACPGAIEDVVSVFQWLLASGVRSDQIVFAGDSAGGGLIVSAMLALKDAGLEMPAGGVCISPWVDLTGTAQTYITYAERDPTLRSRDLARMASSYLGGMDSRDPAASPMFGDLRGLPPLLIHVGTEEILLDDARGLARRAENDGVKVTLEEWSGMFHVWHWYFPLLQEGCRAIESIGGFIKEQFSVA